MLYFMLEIEGRGYLITLYKYRPEPCTYLNNNVWCIEIYNTQSTRTGRNERKQTLL